MLHVQVQKKKRGFAGYLLSFLIFFAVLFFSLFCMNAMQRRSEEESLMSLRDAIRRASVQCYAIEGRYPPSVEYLEENYAVQINRKKYNVFYDGFASNVMPEITIIPIDE